MQAEPGTRWRRDAAIAVPARLGELPDGGRGLISGDMPARLVSGGDPAAVSRALDSARTVVSPTYRTPAGHQGYLEPQAWVALPPENGITRLWGTTKSPYRLRGQIAASLDLPPESIQIDPVPLGGDFGGKDGVCDATLCVALARLVRQPVRLVLRSEEDLSATDARHPAVIRVRVGCDGSGRLVGLDFDAVFDGGAYAAAKPTPQVNLHGALECVLGYRLPSYAMRSRIAYTNTVPKGHMRSPGAPQAVFAIESALDELAAVAGISPLEMRRRNLLVTALQVEGAVAVGGGTSVGLLLGQWLIEPDALVWLGRIPELRSFTVTDQELVIGSAVTLREVSRHPAVRSSLTALAVAAAIVGNPRIRAVATLGGAMAHADPRQDVPRRADYRRPDTPSSRHPFRLPAVYAGQRCRLPDGLRGGERPPGRRRSPCGGGPGPRFGRPHGAGGTGGWGASRSARTVRRGDRGGGRRRGSACPADHDPAWHGGLCPRHGGGLGTASTNRSHHPFG